MSNALAIAAVTATLTDRLDAGITDSDIGALGQIDVTARPPDTLLEGDPRNALNLFPWKITHNAALSNRDMPARSGDGRRLSRNRIALDIHYIMTATGTADLNAPILMGHGMQILHEHPVLGRDAIRDSLTPPPGGASMLSADRRVLVGSDLADQVESIRVTPAKTEGEELSKIWPAFNAALRLSALYQVSVVLLESRRRPQPVLPVRTIGLRVDPLLRPRIDSVRAQDGDRDSQSRAQPLSIGGRMLIEGSGLASDHIQVKLGDLALVPQVAANDPATDRVSETHLSIRLPAGAQSALKAGVLPMRVEHLFPPSGGAAQQREVSPPVPVIIAPGIGQVRVSGTVAASLFDGQVTVSLTHDVGARQSAQLLLNPAQGSAATEGLSVPAAPRTQDGRSLAFPLRDVAAGRYMYRLDIDGAQTELSVDANARYDGPRLTLAASP